MNITLSIPCAIIAMIGLYTNPVQAQIKYHFDIEYHYNLGLSTSYETELEVGIGDAKITNGWKLHSFYRTL